MDDDTFVAHLSSLLDSKEYEAVVQSAAARLDRFDPWARLGSKSIVLIDILTIVGDAHFALADFRSAFESYEQATMLTRQRLGLSSLGQAPLLLKQASALTKDGRRREANERHEYAYSLALNQFGPDDPNMLFPMKQLIDWYESQAYFSSSRRLYAMFVELLEDAPEATPELELAALEGYSRAIKLSRFRPHRRSDQGGFLPRIPGYDYSEFRSRRGAYFDARKVMRDIVDLTDEIDSVSDTRRAYSLIQLADWHLLYRKYGFAMRLYRKAWHLLDSDPEVREDWLSKPFALHISLPFRDPSRSNPRASHGAVELELTVTKFGEVIGRKTVRAEPENIMEYRVRMAARKARFRPAFADGEAVKTRRFPLVYTYEYIPGVPL